MTDDNEGLVDDYKAVQAALGRYPTVSTVEELEALPFGSVIMTLNWQPSNGARPWDKRNWLGPDSTPTGKPWSSYASKNRSSEMLTTSRGRKQVYAVLFNPEAPIPVFAPEQVTEEPEPHYDSAECPRDENGHYTCPGVCYGCG